MTYLSTRTPLQFAVTSAISMLLSATLAAPSRAAGPFRFEYLALTDAEHRSSEGQYTSYPRDTSDNGDALLPSGAVLGWSIQTSATGAWGESAWIAQNGRLTR